MRRKQSWKQMKLSYLKWKYGDKVNEYKKHPDDRGLYAGIYEVLVEGIMSLPEEPHNTVCVAMNAHIRRKCEMLDEIREHFEEKEKAPVV